MNKSELIDAIAEKTGQTKTAVGEVLDQIPALIGKALKKGEPVAIHGLGSFTVRKRAARQGRNPQTGEPLKIKASKSIGFKAAKGFKETL